MASRWRGIVLHHSAAPDHDDVDAERYRDWHLARGWRDIGYHWIVERAGAIFIALLGRPAYLEGAHCPGKNADHLGVCFAGNFEEAEMPYGQLVVGVDLLASLCVMNGFDQTAISVHRDWRQTKCPGRLFPEDKILEAVRQKLEG